MHDAHLRTEGLVADGPYRHVRNPLYMANVPMAVGMGLLASRTGFLILVVGSTLFVRRLITREESDLALAQGQRYRDYCGAIPRLLPSLKPRLPPGGRTPRWGQAVAGEIFFWIFAAATTAFALTLRFGVFWTLVGAGIPTYGIGYAILKVRRRAKPPQS